MRNSRVKRIAITLAACVISGLPGAAPVYSRDKEFGLLVHHVESYYHVRRSYRLLMGFAGLAVKIAHPYGVKNLKLAIFEDHDFSAARDDQEFARVVQAGLRQDWQPIVRVYSKRDGERTAIFARDIRDDVQLLVASVEPSEAVVVQVKLNPDRLSRFLNECNPYPHHVPAPAEQDAPSSAIERMAAAE